MKVYVLKYATGNVQGVYSSKKKAIFAGEYLIRGNGFTGKIYIDNRKLTIYLDAADDARENIVSITIATVQ